MRNLINNILYLLYKYYDRGSSKSIAYENALISLLFIIFLNLFLFLVLFNLTGIIPINETDSRGVKYLIFFIIFVLPGFLLLRAYFKKENIVKMEMEKTKMKKGYFLLVIYFIVSIIVLVIAIKNK